MRNLNHNADSVGNNVTLYCRPRHHEIRVVMERRFGVAYLPSTLEIRVVMEREFGVGHLSPTPGIKVVMERGFGVGHVPLDPQESPY